MANASSVYDAAVAKIREVSIHSPPPPSAPISNARDLRAYIRGLDTYSDYLNPMEYNAIMGRRNQAYSGVGMRIIAHQGRIICLPYPDSPAERAGIKAGDELTAIDDQPVDGIPIMLIASMARGPAGTRVLLTVRDVPTGRLRRVGLIREKRTPQSVVGIDSPDGLIIQLTDFTLKTPEELKSVLTASTGVDRPVMLDLRNNIGGNLGGAVEAAGLFLHPGSPVLTVRTRNQSTSYKSQDGMFAEQPPLILLQNRFTASAAEVFIAALVQNNRAVSFGPRTFGKGLSQKIIELSDGSAMFITDAELIPPNGISYHGRGLDGMHQAP